MHPACPLGHGPMLTEASKLFPENPRLSEPRGRILCEKSIHSGIASGIWLRPTALTLLALFAMNPLIAWKPVSDAMLTRWGQEVNPDNAWREYPRPQMVRPEWESLNGLWDLAVLSHSAPKPLEWPEKILVPYALETPLSGIGRRLAPDEAIWYSRTFEVTDAFSDRLLLHFEGVDHGCMVWVNDTFVGDHTGGNLPFSFEITDAVRPGENRLVLRVLDHTDDPDRYQLRGKQKRQNTGIWYTPSSGIWAPVWIEPVPRTSIERLETLADMQGTLRVRAHLSGTPRAAFLKVTVWDGETRVAERTGQGTDVVLSLKHPKLWSPEQPHLYQLECRLVDADGTVLDAVQSYTGFRSVGKVADPAGNWRFTLNGEGCFHFGPLDQGWWPDSFLLPPSDEAIVWEMEFLKKAGFNMIRKHKKVEPRRYYYHADRLGFLVWQDQTSGGTDSEWPKWQEYDAFREGFTHQKDHLWNPGDALEADWPSWAHRQFLTELRAMLDTLYNHPCVVVWTTFNERWGQHRSIEVGTFVRNYDPSRHLNIASGGNFFPVTDIADAHHYPDPFFPLNAQIFEDYIKVIGEYGGHGWPVEGHLWDNAERNWGYGGLPGTFEEYVERYRRSARLLGEYRRQGISGGVYTQTTDVEGEINGLITYDREVIKIPPEQLLEIHREAGLL